MNLKVFLNEILLAANIRLKISPFKFVKRGFIWLDLFLNLTNKNGQL